MMPKTLLQVILPRNSPVPKVLTQLFVIMLATEYSFAAPVTPTLQSNAVTHTEQNREGLLQVELHCVFQKI